MKSPYIRPCTYISPYIRPYMKSPYIELYIEIPHTFIRPYISGPYMKSPNVREGSGSIAELTQEDELPRIEIVVSTTFSGGAEA